MTSNINNDLVAFLFFLLLVRKTGKILFLTNNRYNEQKQKYCHIMIYVFVQKRDKGTRFSRHINNFKYHLVDNKIKYNKKCNLLKRFC